MIATLLRNSILPLTVPISTSALGVEAISNGSFEEDGFSTARLTAGWNDGEVPGFNVHRYPYVEEGEIISEEITTFEFPPGFNPDEFNGSLAPNGAGDLFSYAWGRTLNMEGMFTGSGAQHIDVTMHSRQRYEFRAWLASRIGDNTDYAIVELEFFDGSDASGDSLEILTFDGNDQQSAFIVGSLGLDGFADPAIGATQDNWTLYRARGTIPEGASSAAVRILGRSVAPIGLVNRGYVDLVSLQVVPEPASVALLATLAAILIASRGGTASRWVRAHLA